MATLDFPNIIPDAETWTLTYNTQTFTSDLNGAIQTAELPGARWSVSMTFTNRQGVDARRLQAFLASLRGRSDRFYVTPSDWQPYGTPEGAGAVSLDAQAGSTTVETDGWDADISGLFIAGDYLEVNGELKKVTADSASDSLGGASITFAPPLRKAVTDGMAIRVEQPRATMMLDADDNASWAISAPRIYAVTINAMEALDI